MRRVIRNIKTREFFQAGTWTLDASAAQDFPDTRDLLTTCAQYQLKDVELVVQTGYEAPGTYDINVPLPSVEYETSSLAPRPAAY